MSGSGATCFGLFEFAEEQDLMSEKVVVEDTFSGNCSKIRNLFVFFPFEDFILKVGVLEL